MSYLLSASDVKDFLAQCPICTEYFDEDSRIPRRMPCCVQSICQPCLETYSRGSQILDYLKIQKGVCIPCTDCPDKNNAIARCEDCTILLCKECLSAHQRVKPLRDHRTVTIEEMQGRPLESFHRRHQCVHHQQPQQFFCHTCSKAICVSCTVVDHDKEKGHNVVSVDEAHQEKIGIIENILSQVDQKAAYLKETSEKMETEAISIKSYSETAKLNINKTFSNLMELLQERKDVLIAEVDTRLKKSLAKIHQDRKSALESAVQLQSATDYTRKMRSKADKTEDLQLMTSSEYSMKKMLVDSPKSVELARSVVSFIPTMVTEMASIIKETGLVKEVTFSHVHGTTKDSAVPLLNVSVNQDSEEEEKRSKATAEGKVSVLSCNTGDLVVLWLDESRGHYVVVTAGQTFHFLATDCLETLGLSTDPGQPRKPWVIAVITGKEYCQAKKPQNRFNVPVGTKFYRVKAKPWKPWKPC